MAAAVEVEGVSKDFRLYHERYSTLKERLVRFGGQRFERFDALRDVTFSIDQGSTFGLIGANGSGKTTLLKIIAGILRPSSGTVRTRGRLAALLELGAGFHPDLTGRENVYMNASILGLTGKETHSHFDEIVSFAELERFIDNQVKHYSSGMYVRLGFAVAVHVDPEILLVDEVLAVGDEAFQRKCLDRIRQFQEEGRTIVFVTHAVDLVRQICDRAVMLAGGVVEADGKPVEVIRRFRGSIHEEEASDFPERGTREAEITACALLGPSGSPRSLFAPGDDLVLRIDILPNKTLPEIVVGMAVHDERDQLVYGTNTLKQGIRLSPFDRSRRVEFLLPSLPMLDGRFAVTVGVHSPDDQVEYHWLERRFPFEVRSSGEEVGLVHLRAQCRILEPDRAPSTGS